MVDPSKVKLPKELRKIKSKVAKETKSMSFTKAMKRLKSPKRQKMTMNNSLGELKVPGGDSMGTSPRQFKEKRVQSSGTRMKETTATFGGGNYNTTTHEQMTTKDSRKLPEMRNTI